MAVEKYPGSRSSMMHVRHQKASSSSMNSNRQPATKFMPCDTILSSHHQEKFTSSTSTQNNVQSNSPVQRLGKQSVANLTVPHRWVASSIRGQEPTQGIAPSAIHHWMPWEGPVQVLLDLHVPVPAAVVLRRLALCWDTLVLCYL